jgi:hypothetical protein
VAIAVALRVPRAELDGLPAEPSVGSARTLPRVRHGIEFSGRDDSNGELRVTGDDDAAVFLWAAAWLDEHRDWVVTSITFRYPAVPWDEGRHQRRMGPNQRSARDTAQPMMANQIVQFCHCLHQLAQAVGAVPGRILRCSETELR